MIPYRYLSYGDIPSSGYWDQTLLADIFKDSRFTATPGDGSIVVMPGASMGQHLDKINEELQQYKWVVLIITSDEESNFPVEQIKHNRIKIYVQYPKYSRHQAFGKWPVGYTPTTRENLICTDKSLDYFFAGQVTHARRVSCIDALDQLRATNVAGSIHPTQGFATGLSSAEYMRNMCLAKTAPAPTGPRSHDSFRVYEALEAGAIPVADGPAFWRQLFGGVPFPTTNTYANFPGYVLDQIADYPRKNNRVQAWWLKIKRDLKHQLINDVHTMTGLQQRTGITAIVPVSPIKSHPDTAILDETIASIRAHLDCEILITFDGVRAAQEDRRADYEEFIRRAIYKCNTEWNAIPLIFDQHCHQSGMGKAVLEHVKTPAILYVEQDTPLVPDAPIDWDFCVTQILTGAANLIRFHFETKIPECHEHMMIGGPENGLQKTVQWSQRPHVASTAFYRHILDTYFSHNANCFIEDLLHGKLHNAFVKYGVPGWSPWRVFIYHPEGSIKRSYHTDGRAGEHKFDGEQIW